jgi:hypothetical protein
MVFFDWCVAQPGYVRSYESAMDVAGIIQHDACQDEHPEARVRGHVDAEQPLWC